MSYPIYRKQGIASQLIKACEQLANNRGFTTIGLGVGLTEDYGNAQRLYTRLGYSHDGKGIHYKNNLVNPGDKVVVDDDLHLYLKKSL
jgi:GNAT superfamily N-acetyltransferase